MYDNDNAERRIIERQEEKARSVEDKIEQCIVTVIVLLFWLLPIFFVACKPLESPRSYAMLQMAQHSVYVPIAANGGCTFSQEASRFYALLTADQGQKHPRLVCNMALNAAALNRAQSMAINGYFAHCDLGGVCANDYARAAGCKLPSDYGNGNNIESLVAGVADAGGAYAALIGSPSHRKHLLGDGEFFRAQDQVGIALYSLPESPYTFYWVILIGKCM